MDQVRPLPAKWLCEHAFVDWPASSSSNPIRRRPCADPVQKHDPGDWITLKKGLTARGPLQKGGQKARSAVPAATKTEMAGTAQVRLCPPYAGRWLITPYQPRPR